MKKIVFIAGSLRKGSYNTQLMEMAAKKLSSAFIGSFLDYSDIPLLNQDKEFQAPDSVARIRDEIRSADALWIGSPEYNHSYSAVLKNLIDWLSRPVVPGDYSTAAGRGRLVALSSVAGSSGGSFSLSKLRELLEMLSCTIIEEQTLVALGSRFGSEELVLTAEEEKSLSAECDALANALA